MIDCNKITKIFCTRYDSANTSSARSPCDFGPLADLAISIFREVRKNTVFTSVLAFPHFHLTRLLECDLNDQFPLKVSWVLKVDELEEDLE